MVVEAGALVIDGFADRTGLATFFSSPKGRPPRLVPDPCQKQRKMGCRGGS
jgi:hypothetical protein